MPDGTQYDDTNRGVIFKPRENARTVVGSGKLNINGHNYPVKVVMEPLTRDGVPEWVVYAKIGVLFTNQNPQSENSPDRSGPLDLFPNLRMAAWKNEKDGRPYFQLKVSERQTQSRQPGGDDGWGAPASPAPQTDGWGTSPARHHQAPQGWGQPPQGQPPQNPPQNGYGYIEDEIPF